MKLLILLSVLGVAFTANLPTPRIKHLSSGALEISIDDVPGYHFKHIQYTIGNVRHMGPFHKAVDGKWYHRNMKVAHGNAASVHYQITGEHAGKEVLSQGILEQAQSVVAVAPPERMRRAGNLVFRDDFNGGSVNEANWDYEISMYGGFNWEIQVYTKDQANVFTRNGHLYLKPTLTANDPKFSEDYLHHGVMDVAQLWGSCTNSARYGCHREGQYGLLPPVMSGKLKSKHTTKYGHVCVRAKIPKGDWLWPAIWMLPRSSVYGGWPRSGEIDMMESRGNTRAEAGGVNHGVNEVSSTLHWGPDAGHNGFQKTHGEKRGAFWSNDFHTYCLDWTHDHIKVTVDNADVLYVPKPSGGFWQKGGFSGSNPWSHGGMAPFDQQFYLILNVAVGGTKGFFPDGWHYNSPKPYKNNSPQENEDFWNKRNDWLPSWHGDHVAMVIDYVEMSSYY